MIIQLGGHGSMALFFPIAHFEMNLLFFLLSLGFYDKITNRVIFHAVDKARTKDWMSEQFNFTVV